MFKYGKLRDAIHYICQRNNEKDGILDDVKLNKILWYTDALMYMSTGDSITGTTYMRKPRGPVAKYHSKAIRELIEASCIKEGKSEVDGDWRPTFDSIRVADTTAFTAAERQMFDRVYDYVTRVSTREISEQTHGNVWRIAREKEEIPLYTVYAEGVATPTPAEMSEAASGLGA